ncbi:GNAT family N-acetyltransferase [Nocardiopsis sp. NPDC006198]|uniref:GNAT family N-acetyltransferase n=1 Tax=Nocardiopsis sp. NPDC006198 TaxID=3154472 RepID=UPI0033A44921
MPPVTRPATAEDLDAVLSLLGELPPDAPPLTAASAARIWSEVSGQEGRTLLVHERDGIVAGTVDCLVVPWTFRDGRPVMLVENLVVAERHRRSGAGSSLIRSAERLARRARCHRIQLLAAGDAYVHAFYRACGFVSCADGFRKHVPSWTVGASL